LTGLALFNTAATTAKIAKDAIENRKKKKEEKKKKSSSLGEAVSKLKTVVEKIKKGYTENNENMLGEGVDELNHIISILDYDNE